LSSRTLLLLVMLALIILNYFHILYFNIFTHSLPQGVYLRTKGSPRIDEYAATCLTPTIARYGIAKGYLAQGNCDSGTVLVLKIIKGLPGDHYKVDNKNLELNGHSYRIMNKDSSSRALRSFFVQNEGILDKGKYILLSDFVPNSWDSRYWGPVGIQFLLKPLWILENVKK